MRPMILISLLCTPWLWADQWPRYEQLDVQHYDVAVQWPGEGATIHAQVQVDFRVVGRSLSSFHLDLVNTMRVETAALAGQSVGFQHQDDRLSITPPQPLAPDTNYRLDIVYSGQPTDGLIIGRNQYGNWTVFSDHWPNRARHWLPVVDHPSDKATVRFAVTAPAQFQVVAVGQLVAEIDREAGLRETVWHMSHPIPTKVMVVGIAHFAVFHHPPYDNKPVQSWVFAAEADHGMQAFEPTARQALAYFEREIGPYPYDKLANVVSRTRYGGMENAGTIFYTEKLVEMAPDRRESLIAHEIAHQWFGNHLAEASWEHVWISEGFATYWAARFHAYRHGAAGEHSRWRDMRQRITAARLTGNATPVIQNLALPSNDLLTVFSYQQGAFFLRMLRQRLGNDTFANLIKQFYARFSGDNATTADFMAMANNLSGKDQQPFFDYWLRSGQTPTIAAVVQTKGADFNLTAKASNANQDVLLPLTVDVHWQDGSRQRIILRWTKDGTASHTRNLAGRVLDNVILDPEVNQLAIIKPIKR